MVAKTPLSLRSCLWFPCSIIWPSLSTRILLLLHQGTPSKLRRRELTGPHWQWSKIGDVCQVLCSGPRDRLTESRCAIDNDERPRTRFCRAFWMSRSVEVSRALSVTYGLATDQRYSQM